MGLIRLIIIVLLVYLAWRLVKATLARGRDAGTPRHNRDSNEQGEKMLPCARCGVHVPESGAFMHGGKAFCSHEHQREYLENHDR